MMALGLNGLLFYVCIVIILFICFGAGWVFFAAWAFLSLWGVGAALQLRGVGSLS